MALDTNLISYWKLDETTGNAVDSVSANNGTVGSSVTRETGKINYGITQADGASNLGITIGDIATLDLSSYPLSISAWFKTNASISQDNGNMVIYSTQKPATNYSQYVLSMLMSGTTGDRGKISLNYRNSSGTDYTLTTSSAYNDGNWHHVAATIGSGGAEIIYIDGSSVATGVTASGAMFTGTKRTTIGVNWDVAAAGVWVGSLDEIGVWSKELSSTEVSSLYNSGNGNQYPFGTIYTLACTVGAFTLTGINAIFNRGLMMTTSVGDFTLTGIDALFKRGKGIACAVGDFTLTGIDTTITSARHLTTSVGAFTLTGIDVLLYKAKILTASVGNFVLTGLPINFTGNGSWKWKNQTKNTSSWTDETKNSSSWTNENKL